MNSTSLHQNEVFQGHNLIFPLIIQALKKYKTRDFTTSNHSPQPYIYFFYIFFPLFLAMIKHELPFLQLYTLLWIQTTAFPYASLRK